MFTVSPQTVSVDQIQPPSAARLQQNVGMDVDQIVPEPRSQGHGGSHSAPPSSNDYVSHQQPLQQLQQQQSLATTEYTAWTIGSTETIKNHFANNSASAQASSSNSVYSSAILAKCSSRQASPAPTEISMLSGASSVTPPPPPVTNPTLGGLSQSLIIDHPMEGTTSGVDQGGQGQQGGLHTLQNQVQSNKSIPPQYPKVHPGPSPSPPPPPPQTYNKELQLLYQNRLLSTPIAAVESLLMSSCESLNFDIAEMWLRTGPKTHQLTNSHVRPTALDESVRKQLVDVYYGERSAERTHRLSPALCKRSKEAGDVVWVTAHTLHGAEALKCSISDVRTAVAVPVCHAGSGVNVTIIYFSIRR